MPFLENILKYLPLINTGASIVGNVLGGRAQQNAISNAGQINQQATNDAMRTILGLYDEGQTQLGPYRGVGVPALNNLQRMANPGQAMAPIQAPPAPSNALARFGPGSAANPMTGIGAGAVTNSMAINPGGQAASSGVKNSLIGTGLGMGAAAGIGALSGSMTALGALGGPIGMGLGALGGYVASRFGRNNPYKASASKGIDQVSRNIWGTNTPGIPPEQLTSGYVADALHGKITAQQAKDMINKDLNEWVAGMRANGTPDSVLQSSIATQKQYLAPLKDIFARLESQPAA